MIKGVTSIYRPIRSGKIHLGIKKTKVVNGKTVEYPSETDNFILRDAPDLKNIYGTETHVLHVSLPSARFEKEDFQAYLDRVFPQFLKMYKSFGLFCKGDGETATRINEERGVLEERECPCELFESGDCKKIGIFRFRVSSLPSLNIFQITTGSFNSLVNINSFCRDLLEHCIVSGIDVSSVRLILTRRAETTQHISGGKAHKGKHFIMNLDLDPNFYKSLDDLGKKALRQNEAKPLELPAPDETKDDLFFQEAERAGDVYSEEQKKFMKTDLNNVLSPTGGFIGSGGADDKKDAIAASAITGKKVTTEEIKKMRSEQKTSGIHDLGTEQGFPEGPPNGEPMKLTQDEPKKVKPKPPDEKAPLRAAFAALVKAGGIIPKDECNKFAGAMTKKDIDYWTKVLNDRTAYLRRIAKG